jgi:hypothetical protein
MKKILFQYAAVLASLTLLLFTMCTTPVANGGTEVGNPKISAMLYNPGGSPAANAKVRFYPIHYNPRTGSLAKALAAGVDSTTTDAKGNYTAKLDTGMYNVLAAGDSGVVYQDSITVVKDSTIHPPADTLKAPGTIRGVVRLQPGDDARKVFILAMGTNTFSSPSDSVGNFSLANMADGRYSVRIISILDNYGVLDTSLSIRAGKNDTLADTIVLPFTGIPTPKGLTISYDTLKQIVTLAWTKADTALVKSYNVYRRNVDSNTVAVRINASPVADTVYRDSTGVQGTTYEYLVAAVNRSSTEGTKSAAAGVKVVSGFALAASIGTKGSSDNQLFMPRNAKSTRSFYVVLDVVDPYPSAVKAKLFDFNGSFIRAFTVRQNSNADYLYQLNSAIDSQSNIYVAFKDTTYEYDTSGNLLAAFPLAISDFEIAKTFLQANGSVRLYSLDTLSQRVIVQNLTGGVVSAFSISIPSYAVGNITADAAGNSYVADNSSMKIYKYDPSGNLVVSWGSKGVGFGKLGSIQGIVADNAGRLFVNDEVNSQVQIFNTSGAFIGHFSTFFNTKKWQGTVNDNSEPVNLFLNTDSSLGILEGNVYDEIHVFKPLSSINLP